MTRRFSVLLSGSLFSARDYANLDHRGNPQLQISICITINKHALCYQKEWSFSFRLIESAIQCIYRFSFREIKKYTNSVFIYLPKP